MKRTALARRTPLARSTTPLRARKHPAVRIGKVTGKVRLSGMALEQLRERVYRRDKGQCQWPNCGVSLPLYGSVFNRAHLAHRQSRGAGGSDTEANTRILCFHHHIECEHTTGIKPYLTGGKEGSTWL